MRVDAEVSIKSTSRDGPGQKGNRHSPTVVSVLPKFYLVPVKGFFISIIVVKGPSRIDAASVNFCGMIVIWNRYFNLKTRFLIARFIVRNNNRCSADYFIFFLNRVSRSFV